MTNKATYEAGHTGDAAGTDANGRSNAAAEKLREASAKLRETAGTARTKASDAYATARERAGTTIEQSPLAAVVGGLALGALVGALLPRTRTEGEYLGSVGNRITDAARKARETATESGRGKLEELGINRDAARDKVSELIDRAVAAVSSAAGSGAAGSSSSSSAGSPPPAGL